MQTCKVPPNIGAQFTVIQSALHIPFHLTSALETETGAGLRSIRRGMRMEKEEEEEGGRRREGGEAARLNLLVFAPGVCAAAAATVALSLSKDWLTAKRTKGE